MTTSHASSTIKGKGKPKPTAPAALAAVSDASGSSSSTAKLTPKADEPVAQDAPDQPDPLENTIEAVMGIIPGIPASGLGGLPPPPLQKRLPRVYVGLTASLDPNTRAELRRVLPTKEGRQLLALIITNKGLRFHNEAVQKVFIGLAQGGLFKKLRDNHKTPCPDPTRCESTGTVCVLHHTKVSVYQHTEGKQFGRNGTMLFRTAPTHPPTVLCIDINTGDVMLDTAGDVGLYHRTMFVAWDISEHPALDFGKHRCTVRSAPEPVLTIVHADAAVPTPSEA